MMAATHHLILTVSAIIFLVFTTLPDIHGEYNGYDACATLKTQFPYLVYYEITYIPSASVKSGQNVPTTAKGTGILVSANYFMIGAEVPYDIKNGGVFISMKAVFGECDPSNPVTPYQTGFERGDLSYSSRYSPFSPNYNVGMVRIPIPVTGIRFANLVQQYDEVIKAQCYGAGYGSTQGQPAGTINNATIAQNPLLCSQAEVQQCINNIKASFAPNSPPAYLVSTTPSTSNPILCSGYFNNTPFFQGPCGADLNGPLQCNLKGGTGLPQDQVVVGFVRFPSCNITIPGGTPNGPNGTTIPPNTTGTTPSILTNVYPNLDDIAALQAPTSCVLVPKTVG